MVLMLSTVWLVSCKVPPGHCVVSVNPGDYAYRVKVKLLKPSIFDYAAVFCPRS